MATKRSTRSNNKLVELNNNKQQQPQQQLVDDSKKSLIDVTAKDDSTIDAVKPKRMTRSSSHSKIESYSSSSGKVGNRVRPVFTQQYSSTDLRAKKDTTDVSDPVLISQPDLAKTRPVRSSRKNENIGNKEAINANVLADNLAALKLNSLEDTNVKAKNVKDVAETGAAQMQRKKLTRQNAVELATTSKENKENKMISESSNANVAKSGLVKIDESSELLTTNSTATIKGDSFKWMKINEKDEVVNVCCDNKKIYTKSTSTPSGARRKPLKPPPDISFIVQPE